MKDGYYWIRYKMSDTWSIGKIKDDMVLRTQEDIPASFFDIGDPIETPEKYREGK